jgi:hypothetical protein
VNDAEKQKRLVELESELRTVALGQQDIVSLRARSTVTAQIPIGAIARTLQPHRLRRPSRIRKRTLHTCLKDFRNFIVLKQSRS